MKNLSIKKREYRDGIKRKETRTGWLDGCCHGDNLRILLINRHMSYIVTADQIVSMTINRACACLLVGF